MPPVSLERDVDHHRKMIGRKTGVWQFIQYAVFIHFHPFRNPYIINSSLHGRIQVQCIKRSFRPVRRLHRNQVGIFQPSVIPQDLYGFIIGRSVKIPGAENGIISGNLFYFLDRKSVV